MSALKPALPYIIDPIGAGIHAATGFGYTPGGAVANAVKDRPRPPKPPDVKKPTVTPPRVSAPAISMPAPGSAPTGPRVPPGDKAGAAPGSDRTQGLLRKPGTGKTLLS